MPLGATFQVTWASPYMSPTEDVYVHTATAANIVGDYTILNDPLANGNPNAVVQVTANYNPPGLGGVYNNHPIGVWYTGSRWAIFNQDAAGMPVGAHFNVMVLPSSESHPNVGWYVHTSSSSNISATSPPSPRRRPTPIRTSWSPRTTTPVEAAAPSTTTTLGCTTMAPIGESLTRMWLPWRPDTASTSTGKPASILHVPSKTWRVTSHARTCAGPSGGDRGSTTAPRRHRSHPPLTEWTMVASA